MLNIKLVKIHQDLIGSTDLVFSSKINPEIDVLFLCLGHGNSKAFLEKNSFSETTKIIDLSTDFRLEADSNLNGKGFVYGLPELQKEAIKKQIILQIQVVLQQQFNWHYYH